MTNILELLKNEKVEWKKLGEIGDIFSGLKGVTAEDFKTGTTKYIPYISVFNNYEITNDSMLATVRINNIDKQNPVQVGDVLFTSSSENKEDAGMTAVVTDNLKENTYLNSFCFIYRFSKDIEVLPSFSKHIFRSIELRKKISNTAQGVTRFNISKERILSIEIPIPSQETQEKIVEILDKFTNYVTELQSELQSRTKQYTYYRDKLLSEDYLNKITKEMEDDRKLEIVTLGEIGEFTRGNGLQKKDFKDKGNPVIHYGQIYTKYGFTAEKVVSYTSDEIFSKLRKAQKNDILIATTSENIEDVGKSVVWLGDEEVGFSGDMYSYSTQQNSKYIAYCFQTNNFQRQKKKKATGTKMIRIHANDMEKFEIPLPPLSLQNKIVKVLDKFQILIADTKGLLPEEIEQRQKQYEYYREKLLTFDVECDSTHIIISNVYYNILQEAAGIVGVDIEDKVEWKRISDFCKRQKGINITAKQMKELTTEDGDVKVFAGGNTVAYLYQEIVGRENIVDKPSVIVKSRGNIDFEYFDKLFTHKNEMWSYSISDENNIKYLYYYMKTNTEYFRSRATSGKLPQISTGITDNYKITLPPLHVQQHVVSILDKFDTLVNDIKEGLPKEIEQRQKQYEYWRECLLNFPKQH